MCAEPTIAQAPLDSKQESHEIQHITGETGHKYFHMMLNMADDDLNCHEYRLLGHYLRWAGHGGMREEGIRQTAKVCHMGQAALRKARQQLVEKGYLKVSSPTLEQTKEGKPTQIIVVDRWSENVDRYQTDTPPVSKQIHPLYPNRYPPCIQTDTPPVSKRIHKEEHTEEHKEERTKEKERNYLTRPKRYKNEAGKWEWTSYVLHESPLTENQSMDNEKAEENSPLTENQLLETSDWKPVDIHNTEDRRTENKKDSAPPANITPLDGDKATYEDWQNYLNREFKIGKSAPTVGYLYNMFKNRAVKGGYKEFNITPTATLTEVQQWVAYEKREAKDGKFLIRKAETINAKFLYWREKRRAVEVEKQYRAELESA